MRKNDGKCSKQNLQILRNTREGCGAISLGYHQLSVQFVLEINVSFYPGLALIWAPYSCILISSRIQNPAVPIFRGSNWFNKSSFFRNPRIATDAQQFADPNVLARQTPITHEIYTYINIYVYIYTQMIIYI